MGDENDQLSTRSQNLTKRLNQHPSQVYTSSKGSGSMRFQDSMQKGNPSHLPELSVPSSTYGSQGSYMLSLLPTPNILDDSSKVSIVLDGTACRGGNGPPVGAVDIGIGKSAYYFRIALPGVKKDPGMFVCLFVCLLVLILLLLNLEGLTLTAYVIIQFRNFAI